MTEQALLPQIREDLEVEALCAFSFKNILNQEISLVRSRGRSAHTWLSDIGVTEA